MTDVFGTCTKTTLVHTFICEIQTLVEDYLVKQVRESDQELNSNILCFPFLVFSAINA